MLRGSFWNQYFSSIVPKKLVNFQVPLFSLDLKMATISAHITISSFTQASLVHKRPNPLFSSPTTFGLPVITTKGRARSSMEKKVTAQTDETKMGMKASLIAAIGAATSISGPALALVDERLSTEGTGLPFGLSNNLLGWILLGVFGLIWTLYFTYASALDEDDDSGLSL